MSVVEKVSLGLVLLFLLVAIWRLFKTPMKLALRQANLYTAGLLHSSVPSFCKTSSYPPPGRLK